WALREAAAKGWKVFEWCLFETMEPHGWLSAAEVTRKKAEMPEAMWNVEVLLQQPAFEGRAFLPDKIELMFSGPEVAVGDGEYREFEAPQDGVVYVHGADWAKATDWTC